MTHDLIPLAFLVMAGFIVKVISDNRVRRILIEKGESDPVLKDLLNLKSKNGDSSLKWGMVALAIGLGLIITHNMSEGIILSALFISAGLALVIFYVINNRKKES